MSAAQGSGLDPMVEHLRHYVAGEPALVATLDALLAENELLRAQEPKLDIFPDTTGFTNPVPHTATKRLRGNRIEFWQRTWRTLWLRQERIVQRWTGRRWERCGG